MDKVPIDVIRKILHYLDMYDLISILNTCKRFKNISKDKYFWVPKFKNNIKEQINILDGNYLHLFIFNTLRKGMVLGMFVRFMDNGLSPSPKLINYNKPIKNAFSDNVWNLSFQFGFPLKEGHLISGKTIENKSILIYIYKKGKYTFTSVAYDTGLFITLPPELQEKYTKKEIYSIYGRYWA